MAPSPAPSPGVSFDPFSRAALPIGPASATSLSLTLYGTRASGSDTAGSAIIGTPDGQQRSFAVGEQILPGVTLRSVAHDNVTIERNGILETLSFRVPDAGTMIGAAAPEGPVAGSVGSDGSAVADLAQVQFQPRFSGGQMTGIVVQPDGSGAALSGVGLAAGDVILSVNGERLVSVAQAAGIARQIGSGPTRLEVERNGQVVPVTVGAGR